MQPKAGEVTALLGRVRDGDSGANDALISLLYDELRRVARGLMSRERHRVTLQPTALVHEAYLRLAAGGPSGGWNSRAHFLAAAARAMRRILIERARRRHRQRRGGDLERVTLDEGSASYEVRTEDLIALDEALERLADRDPAMARVVELRYFGGLTVEESAAATGLSARSVSRAWTAARAWLHRAVAAAPLTDEAPDA
jgi:RNA polymerase sigma factor (TIGR02999 family)